VIPMANRAAKRGMLFKQPSIIYPLVVFDTTLFRQRSAKTFICQVVMWISRPSSEFERSLAPFLSCLMCCRRISHIEDYWGKPLVLVWKSQAIHDYLHRPNCSSIDVNPSNPLCCTAHRQRFKRDFYFVMVFYDSR